jgi:predicted O-methyltransferase YrrM
MSCNRSLITKLFNKYVSNYRNYSISLEQAIFIADGIYDLTPKRFIEVGTCTGTSTALIANAMHSNEGQEIVTLDLLAEWQNEEKDDLAYKAMRSKKIGHMIPIMYPQNKVKVRQHTGVHSSFLPSKYFNDKFDMGFIDASHVHPWTTLDAIATFPCLKDGTRVYFHDVNLHRVGLHDHSKYAIGVKHLFDQFPDNLKHISHDNGHKNIGYVDIPKQGYKELADAMIDSLYVPWTLSYRLGHSVILSYAKLANEYWGEDVAMALLDTSNRYNREQTYTFSLKDIN